MIVTLTKELVEQFGLWKLLDAVFFSSVRVGISGFFLFRYFTTFQNCLISEEKKTRNRSIVTRPFPLWKPEIPTLTDGSLKFLPSQMKRIQRLHCYWDSKVTTRNTRLERLACASSLHAPRPKES